MTIQSAIAQRIWQAARLAFGDGRLEKTCPTEAIRSTEIEWLLRRNDSLTVEKDHERRIVIARRETTKQSPSFVFWRLLRFAHNDTVQERLSPARK